MKQYLALLLILSVVSCATYTWTNGNANNIWEEDGNWDIAGYPNDLDDNAIFNEVVDDCNMTEAQTINSTTLTTNYTGTLTLEAQLKTGEYTQNNGVTILNNNTLLATTWTLDGGTFGSNSPYTLKVKDFTLGTGTMNDPNTDGGIEVTGDLISTAAHTWNPNGGVMLLTGVNQTTQGFSSHGRYLGSVEIRTSDTLTITGIMFVGDGVSTTTRLIFNTTGTLNNGGAGSIYLYSRRATQAIFAPSMPVDWDGVGLIYFSYAVTNHTLPSMNIINAGQVWIGQGRSGAWNTANMEGDITITCDVFIASSADINRQLIINAQEHHLTINTTTTSRIGWWNLNRYGSVTATTGTIEFNGDVSMRQTGSIGTADTAYNLIINGALTIHAQTGTPGIINAPNQDGSLKFSGITWNQESGTFNNNNGTVLFNRNGTSTLLNNATNFSKVQISQLTFIDTSTYVMNGLISAEEVTPTTPIEMQPIIITGKPQPTTNNNTTSLILITITSLALGTLLGGKKKCKQTQDQADSTPPE